MSTPEPLRSAILAMRAVRLLGAATPSNAEAELERLDARFSTGQPCMPRWTHRSVDVSGASIELGRVAAALRDARSPWGSLALARIDELCLEAALVESVARPAFAGLAARRFRTTARSSRAADALAAKWPLVAPEEGGGELVPTDSSDPRSLLSRVRAEIGARRAPFTVRVAESLGTLAATGERTVYVASGRATSERAARRIALHEVLGHVLPRLRAEKTHPIFALGTARGTDDQEGLALVYEERARLLDGPRRAELARRHVAARAMRQGADFVEVALHLQRRDVPLRHALAVATRVFRGSDGRFAGLGRESVYLTSFAAVRACLAADPGAERLLASGQVAVRALSALRQSACA